jgi:hypothetical protein
LTRMEKSVRTLIGTVPFSFVASDVHKFHCQMRLSRASAIHIVPLTPL